MAFEPQFGRWEDPESVEKVFATQADPFFAEAAPEIMTEVDDNADVDLCEIYEQVSGKPWDSLNQNPRGFCVGFGNAKIATLAIAMMVAAKEISWPGADVAVEPIYGGSRYEVGYQTFRSNMPFGGDGSVGAWAVKWLLEWGLLLKQPYQTGGQTYDFTNYSLSRCDQYGRNGVPDPLEPVAKEKPLSKATLLTSGDQCWKAIGGLNPLVHCSNQGFARQRNSDGTCRAIGNWAHCAGWSGRFVLKNGVWVLRYENSWDGTSAGSGYLGQPIVIEGKNGPIKLNGNQFLVPLEVVDNMCKRGKETYAFAGARGFINRRKLFVV